jgi:SH3-like domain-containing protein
MKVLLFLSLLGAAMYGALLVSHDFLLRDRAKDPSFAQSLGDASDRRLRSWGSDLPALTNSSSQVSSLPLRTPTATTSAHESSKDPASTAGAVIPSETNLSPELGRAAYMPPESAKVTIAARAHSAPSISSPIVHFYPRGTALQVLARENDWVQVIDRASGESGWVLDQYLIETESGGTQTALETSKTTDPMTIKPMPSARKSARGHKPQVRNTESVALARFDRRWDRRPQRRGGFGLFFFGRFARAE